LNPKDPSYWVLDQVRIGSDGSTAQVKGCRWSTNVLESANGAIFNDEKMSLHATIDLVAEGTTWFVSNINNDRSLEGTNDCGSRP
jgi:hypothetical protein